ncbi:hypothetical protein TVAG_499680 [Trichomonas vaginalis G3]|uniref:Uncharacterized protein n=1 Tax=Trichomonas vaginalis (strain ATCC PRA-98 / G3) TaxID=412133 RepID=A2EIQ3_TRIV3|nr:homeobox protein BARH-like family [Trichomonas vaginalis G3]EAY07480.1 hypothetical protein TVAG_499680 [Trichomonas vaginalis G3]KAI5487824.1 homeobox protein BARH-like family [Trichomonas vaginalis G3]|eukprot:XP_001319703.1 hypothetical protein [Trichomonas vaginalis G3]
MSHQDQKYQNFQMNQLKMYQNQQQQYRQMQNQPMQNMNFQQMYQNQLKNYQMAFMNAYGFPPNQQNQMNQMSMKTQNMMQPHQNQQNQMNQMQMMPGKMVSQNPENSPAQPQQSQTFDASTMSRSASNTSLSSMAGPDMAQQNQQMMNASNFMQSQFSMQMPQNNQYQYQMQMQNSLQNQMQSQVQNTSTHNLLSQMQQQQQQQQQQPQPSAPQQAQQQPPKPPQMPTQKKQKSNQMNQNKRKPKKHAAPSDIAESPLPPAPEQIQPPIQPQIQNQIGMNTNEISELTRVITGMGEKSKLYYRVFGYNVKRCEIKSFLEYFANNVYKSIPNAVKYAMYIAEQFRQGEDGKFYRLFANPSCPTVFAPVKNIKPQFQILQCAANKSKGVEFNLVPPSKRGDAFPYGVFIPQMQDSNVPIIIDDTTEVLPSSFGDKYMFYIIPQSSKSKISIRPVFQKPPSTPITWFSLCYAQSKDPLEVLYQLLDKQHIKRELFDQTFALTPKCTSCTNDPLKLITQCMKGNAACIECGAPVILNELIIKVKPCAEQKIENAAAASAQEDAVAKTLQISQVNIMPQPLPPEPENPEEERIAMALGESIFQCIRPKQEASGWIKTKDGELFTPVEESNKFYASSLSEMEKMLSDLHDDFF